jgi:uncharacterized membrane protein YhaH (DUF805 family)
MGFGTAIATCFGKYASFTGRARRSELWWFVLFNFIVTVVLNIVDNIAGFMIGFGTYTFDAGDGQAIIDNPQLGALSTIWVLVVFLPLLSVTVRRLHDTNRSGWWWWIQFVPCVGGIILFVFMLLDSTPGDNRFGTNPKGYVPTM